MDVPSDSQTSRHGGEVCIRSRCRTGALRSPIVSLNAPEVLPPNRFLKWQLSKSAEAFCIVGSGWVLIMGCRFEVLALLPLAFHRVATYILRVSAGLWRGSTEEPRIRRNP